MRFSAVFRLPFFRLAVSALCSLALVGCVASPQAPRSAPNVAVRPVPAAVVVPQTPPSAASVAVRQHFARVQADLLSNGLLRTDGGGRDTPFTDRMLAENFIRIALYDEYVRGTSGPVQRQTASRLRRWETPVRVGLRFGASVSASSRATDTARVRSYLARLNRLTGHPIALDDSAPNFWLYIVNEDERRALGPTAAAALPGLSAGELAGITNMPLSTYCLVYAMSDGNSGRYSRAFAVIRSEHPDLLRLSCMHEEIAQGLGLANDSPRARPSIFNDDEEFALLTGQDELML
ncbi:MAG: DUF2927 domain-containing protein, partial [Paracoccaceae bacterium]